MLDFRNLDLRNLNTLWSSVLVETLVLCGLRTAIACPGSRSAPLAVAFAQHPKVAAIPVLDERSASFFALGIAKHTHRPVALVCTSGTAGANFYPAVIEARESQVPLLVLTADRPPELRDCNAGQAIDQQKLFGSYPNTACELATPALDLFLLQYLRQRIAQCYYQAQYPFPGPVHINIPLRDPLAPIEQPEVLAFAEQIPSHFFDHLTAVTGARSSTEECYLATSPLNSIHGFGLTPHQGLGLQPQMATFGFTAWSGKRGVIVAGVAQPQHPQAYCQAIAQLAKTFGFPVLAEGLSPVRNHAGLNPYVVSTYDSILRNRAWVDRLQPEVVLRVGDMPTSKVLREWLNTTQPHQWVIDPIDRSRDPLHGKTIPIPMTITEFVMQLGLDNSIVPSSDQQPTPVNRSYLQDWLLAEQQTRSTIDQAMAQISPLFEGKVAWCLSQILPQGTPLFIANSMPVRDVEYFWQPNDRQIQPFVNRGANGIDGTLSTALGIAQGNQPTVLLTGDLSLLHDTNGFLLRQYFQGHLTIVLVNNNGGGIFGMLPIAQFDPPFEAFFATPQNIDFAQLCQTYGIEHETITDWHHLEQQLKVLPDRGIRVLEVPCDRTQDGGWRRTLLNPMA
ncbi:2-succinyl-5-enolpyruvyl-6-hydroxy-3-cyclohexene-1-carboxylic-acid synthase [Alkalinema pantanalense CENA528]|uniref:2-succinyl-5-enolpyruvyl-6-hydroxy-3- cyclohexene-1-carboxylic-acid synthase n=1 Tax=Alkalinema pantanalense TaxID=1620705 RepID=UPI003D6FA29C